MDDPTLPPNLDPSTEAARPEHVSDDLALVNRIREGDLGAFEQLMRRCNRLVFRTVRSIVHDDDEAEDIMQEAYVRAFVHLGSFEGRSRLSTWMVRIAVHEAYARLAKRKRLALSDPTDETGPLMDTEDDADPERTFSEKELGAVLERAIDRLPDPFRPAFVLRMVEQLSTTEVAACLDIPEETVRTRVFRARALLQRSILEQVDGLLAESFGFHLSRCDRIVGAVLLRLRRH